MHGFSHTLPMWQSGIESLTLQLVRPLYLLTFLCTTLGVLIDSTSLNASDAIVARFLPISVIVGHHTTKRTISLLHVASKSSTQRTG